MIYQPLLLAITSFTATGTLAYPNALPKYQQEILQPSPSVETSGELHFGSSIRDVLLVNQIIPQVLDDFEPTYYLDVAYSKHHGRVLLGNDIPVESVSERPTFTFRPLSGPPSYGDPSDEKNVTLTLILTDPDALSRQKPVKSEMCHWILTNLTTPLGADAESLGSIDFPEGWEELLALDGFDNDGEVLEPASKKKPGEVESYYPPAPPKKTGPHRYVFVLLEGDVSHLKAPKERPHWGYGKDRHGVRDWSAENNLTVVGANFFFAQHKKQ